MIIFITSIFIFNFAVSSFITCNTLNIILMFFKKKLIVHFVQEALKVQGQIADKARNIIKRRKHQNRPVIYRKLNQGSNSGYTQHLCSGKYCHMFLFFPFSFLLLLPPCFFFFFSLWVFYSFFLFLS